MRLFIAAELPYEMIEALSETQAMLRESVRGRYTKPNTLHVTLAFLGDVEQSRIPDIIDAIESACDGVAAWKARLGDLGSFGSRTNATLWQGFSNPKRFIGLAKDIRGNLDAFGIEYDGKPMRAHVTLMRRADLTKGSLPMPVCASAKISQITLFSSELTSDGPIYTAIHTVDLSE